MTAPAWAGVSRLLAYAPAQFWNERPAAEWSEKEVQQLLSRSPWAKEAEAQFKMLLAAVEAGWVDLLAAVEAGWADLLAAVEAGWADHREAWAACLN
jgi:hypothetical protein